MATLSENVEKLVNALSKDKTALTEMKVSVPSSTKHSDIPDLIKVIKTGNQLKIQVSGDGFPSETTYTARHTDGTSVNGKSPLTVDKTGKWTVTDSWSSFSDTVTVSDTYTVSRVLPKLIVTTDIGNGNIQTATCGGTKLESTVSNGQAVFYLPKTGTWTIGYSGSEETINVSVTSRTNYTAKYTKDLQIHFTVSIINGSGSHLYLSYLEEEWEYYPNGWINFEDFGVVYGSLTRQVSLDKTVTVKQLILNAEPWDTGGGDSDIVTHRQYVNKSVTPKEGDTISFDWSQHKERSSVE